MGIQLNILVIGTNRKILDILLRLLNAREGWTAKGISSAEDLLASLRTEKYEILLIGGGLSKETELQLSQQAVLINPEIKTILHYGGGSGLLYAEIYKAMEN